MVSNRILQANDNAFARAERWAQRPLDRQDFDLGWEEGIYFAAGLTEVERRNIFEMMRPHMEQENGQQHP